MRSAEGQADASRAAFADYFRDRLALGSGELTPKDLAEILGTQNIDRRVIDEAAGLLDRLLAARFGAAAGHDQLAQEAIRILEEVERCLKSSAR